MDTTLILIHAYLDDPQWDDDTGRMASIRISTRQCGTFHRGWFNIDPPSATVAQH